MLLNLSYQNRTKFNQNRTRSKATERQGETAEGCSYPRGACKQQESPNTKGWRVKYKLNRRALRSVSLAGQCG